MIKNKDEIKIYYQTHQASIKEVASHFGVSYRTLAHWVKEEGWEKIEVLQNSKTLSNNIVQENLNAVIDVAKVKLKREIQGQIDTSNIDAMTLHNVLDSSTNEILLKALGISFLNANIAQSAILAKDELLKYNDKRLQSDKPDPMFIACAEKVAKMFSDLKTSVYGKNITIETTQNNNIKYLSIDELLALLDQN